MRGAAKLYYDRLKDLFGSIRVADGGGRVFEFHEGIERAAGLIISRGEAGRKLMFIGNGASAAISSHMATDFWKTGGIRAVAFNDSSLLTCISNDFGYEHVFEKPLEMFADPGDLLVAISSSGRSPNVLGAVRAAREEQVGVITLSGFDHDNPLFSEGDLNFHVPHHGYGPVEVVHHSICHCLLDVIMDRRQGKMEEAG
ncbi:MAG: SIS domain-containing protein [Deltaproteobacteria bacterium]|nr:SIS domain-containing protein [Deltaproteobacteria bacterium]